MGFDVALSISDGESGMDPSRCIDGPLVGPGGRVFLAGSLIVFSLLSCATGCHAQQGERSQARGNTIPTLEALPHNPLPTGSFNGWCGDKVVMSVNRRLVIFDRGVQAFPNSFPTGAGLNCGDDNRRLVSVDDEAGWPNKVGWASEIDLLGGIVTRKLATYEKEPRPTISFSPDLKSVTSTRPLTLTPGTADLKVIQLQGSEGKSVDHIRWSRDSSRFLVISTGKGGRGYRRLVEVFDSHHQKIGSGPLPAGLYVKDGWFANSRSLYLFLGKITDEFGTGIILRCKIEGWRCEELAGDVLRASAGGDGILGMVRPIGEYSNTGAWETIPTGYSVDIWNGASQVVARQTFKSSERIHFDLFLAPSGTKVVLTWSTRRNEDCPGKSAEPKCALVINLPGKSK
jgi:hypothetical protein